MMAEVGLAERPAAHSSSRTSSMTDVAAGAPVQPTSAAQAVRGRRRLVATRLVACGLAVGGAAMLPWLVFLAVSLPAAAVARHWPAAWVGLDAMEAAGLICTGVLMLRGDARHRLTAIATAALLMADAWFDITTAAPGSGELTSLMMAALAEVPTAALCAWLACRGLRAQASGGRFSR